ncbi:MAG: hypothetical protein ACPGVU_20820 [Limisphaerales bacterium]
MVASDNSIQTLFAAAPDTTQVYKFDAGAGQFLAAAFKVGGIWINGTANLLPGEAAFVNNGTQTPFTITFVGNVNQGSLTNSLVAGFNLISSQVPQAGLLETDLNAPVSNGEQVYRFISGAYEPAYSKVAGIWLPSQPQIDVGEGFWISKIAGANWTRTFDVNNP